MEPMDTHGQTRVQCKNMPGFSSLKLEATQGHATSLLQSFNTFRHDGHILTDCVLTIAGTPFPIHKALLGASSPYFRALFTSEMRESTSCVIPIGGVGEDTFSSVLDFIYTGEISLTDSNITDVYPAARLFQLDLLLNICCDYFLNQLCPTNCLGIWIYAHAYSDSTLESAVWSYIAKHITEVFKCDEFLSLSPANLCNVLKADDLNTDSEMECYRAVNRWLLHDFSARKDGVPDIISCIRFQLLTAHTLATLATTDALILSDKRLKEIVIQAKNARRLRKTKSRSRRQSMFAFQKDANTPRCPSSSLTVIGGYAGMPVNTVETYCETTNRWTDSELKPPRYHAFVHWVGVIGLRLYAICGKTVSYTDTLLSRFTPEAATHLQTSVLSKDWEMETTLPCDCSGMQFCTMDECIYGCGETILDGDMVYGVSRYDPGAGTWEYLSSLPTTRVHLGLLPHEGKLYLIAGMDPHTYEVLNVVETYDPTTGVWSTLTGLNTARFHLGVAVVNKHIYVVGGVCSDDDYNYVSDVLDGGHPIESVERFDFVSGEWTYVGSLPRSRAIMPVCVWKGGLYVIGGQTDTYNTSKDVFVYHHAKDEWTKLRSIRCKRSYHCAITL